MDNKELLMQIAEMMEQRMAEHTAQIEQRIDEQTVRIRLEIENRVTQRIDVLFDGYKLTHEKQLELEQRVEALEHQTA